MFQTARIKLTSWYVIIIMLISASFSIVIYKALTYELSRVENLHRARQERLQTLQQLPLELRSFFHDRYRTFYIDQELINETKNRIALRLISVNAIILALASAAGYFLAGVTLKPIQEMVDEQKRFITDASHELRTPLTALRAELEVALIEKSISQKESKALLKSNLEEVKNLQNLSNRLLTLSQFKKPDNHMAKNLSLPQVVEKAVKKVTPLAKKKKITIKTSVKNFYIEGNIDNLIELFVILLDNAIKYSDSDKKITVSAQKLDGRVAVNVADQGYGIATKDLPHIFDRFYRVDMSRTSEDVTGSGLGLSIAKEIAESHQGSIRVKSAINKGTAFTVTLPLKQAA